HVLARKPLPSPLLVLTFTAYWLGTVAAPALFGTHPNLSHDYLYTLAIGLAALLIGTGEIDDVLDTARDALLLFILAGLAMVPLQPAMVMDTSYSQGLIAGLPRFGGLATHPVSMGMLAQIALLLLWARPIESKLLNRLCWAMGLAVLVLAQSKTAWVAFLLCSLCMLAMRHGGRVWRRVGDPRHGVFGILVCLSVLLATVVALALLLGGTLQSGLAGFFSSSEGAQLVTLTGRDRIWAVAIEEWQANRMFGYGPDIWGAAYRAGINMPNATHAHNQFMDTLSRSGTVGACALVGYAAVLLGMSLRYAAATRGLSLALFTALALRSISEVPLILFGYGTELFTHLLLLVTLASAAAAAVRQAAPTWAQARFGVAP
ncbi:MAG TPA: O-antigen ligase family protein, partial [Ramlibacter sp.]|nr:O-antigen ligase family protein [Ramlibacter sp.]